MSIDAHLVALTAKHTQLEDMISQENQRPLPNPATISQLKKRKLKIKEELSQFAH